MKEKAHPITLKKLLFIALALFFAPGVVEGVYRVGYETGLRLAQLF